MPLFINKEKVRMNIHETSVAKEVADRIVFLDPEQGSPKDFFSSPKTDRVKSFLEKVLLNLINYFQGVFEFKVFAIVKKVS